MSKTNLISLIVITLTSFLISCSDVEQVTTDATKDGMTKDSTFIKQNDSLKRVVNGLIKTNYDSIVTSLKLLSEHKNSIFLTPKQTADYLASAYRNQARFVVEKDFFHYESKKWQKFDDTTMFKIERTWSCHINFDTTQSLSPIIRITRDSYDERKNLISKDESIESYHSLFTFYYIPKLKIGYVVDCSNGTGYSSTFYRSTLHSSDDRDIRNDFINQD